MGFNSGSGLSAVGVNFADIAVNTNLAAAGVLGATVGSMIAFKTLDVSQMGNGAIAGLVAITAPCAFVDRGPRCSSARSAAPMVPFIRGRRRRVRVDDPGGALPAHGVAGIGTLAIGLFLHRHSTGGARAC